MVTRNLLAFAVLVAAAGSAAGQTAPAAPTCDGKSDVLGVARTVEIDTTGAPGFGFEHFKAYDFLRPKEVVLTFDDGPWPHNTPAVIDALAAQCTKATFFPIGKHALWHPEILKQVAARGHTIGSHTWSHANLWKKPDQEAKDEIERGVSAVRAALGKPEAPFFRFPALKHPPEMLKYLAERNIGVFSTDLDSFDFKRRRPGQLVAGVISKLERNGKGIVLMHDFQRSTADDLPDLLKALKAKGYKVVHMTAKEPVKTLASYDAAIVKEFAGNIVAKRPMASVVKTVGE
jgi:peptidoglycan/xylan/chitin deacetylase (PgdA/CDA1 family)